MRATAIMWMRGAVLLLAAFALARCDATTFEAFESSTFHFSIFGYLDATADTQFVRVSPLRDSLFADAAPLDATVVLEDRASGRRSVWRDSVFRLPDGPVHNFWSTEPVEPGGTYQFTVTRSDGAMSSATVTLPAAFAEPSLMIGAGPTTPNPQAQTLTMDGIDELADVQFRYVLRADPGTPTSRLTLSYLDHATRFANGRLAVSANFYEDVRRRTGEDCPSAIDVRVFLAAAAPGWPDFLSLDDETLARPDVVSNVENGIGFLGGVVTQTVEWPGLAGLFSAKQQFCRRGCLTFEPGC